MAADYSWPLTLPQKPQQSSYSESRGVLVRRSQTTLGPAKMRYVGRRSNPFNCTYIMTSEQVEGLEEFVTITRGGVSRFYFPHPRTGEQIEANIVPAEDGAQYALSNICFGMWQVSINFEELP